MLDRALLAHPPLAIEQADLMRLRCPINSDKPLSLQHSCVLLENRSACRGVRSSLYWRSSAQLPTGSTPRTTSPGHKSTPGVFRAQVPVGAPGEAGELVQHHATTGIARPAAEAAGAVDAQNASTAPWKPQNGFHKLPQPSSLTPLKESEKWYRVPVTRASATLFRNVFQTAAVAPLASLGYARDALSLSKGMVRGRSSFPCLHEAGEKVTKLPALIVVAISHRPSSCHD